MEVTSCNRNLLQQHINNVMRSFVVYTLNSFPKIIFPFCQQDYNHTGLDLIILGRPLRQLLHYSIYQYFLGIGHARDDSHNDFITRTIWLMNKSVTTNCILVSSGKTTPERGKTTEAEDNVQQRTDIASRGGIPQE